MDQRFIVPQFIDAEDKIFGPVTVRQFIIVVVGALFIFAAYKLADFTLFILEAFLIVAFTLLFAFVKVNGAPFHLFFVNFLNSALRPKIRIWQKQNIRTEEFKSKNENQRDVYIKPKRLLPSSKLSELSLIIDTGGVYKGEKLANRVNKVNYK
ncbi:PrgI family protein [Candidatus Nomurabacteria bacterium]|nr:PrgI family protein [Candidatus Nomurabacteria bacterium]